MSKTKKKVMKAVKAEENKAVKAVLVPREVAATVADIQQQLQKLQTQINSYLSGLKTGLSIPQDWLFDVRKCTFVAPPVPAPPKK